jgi:hypothetical protein
MLLTRVHRVLLLGGLLTFAACGDFTLVEPEQEQPFLHIHVGALSDETTRYDLNAFFFGGQQIGIVDQALQVEGMRIPPVVDDTRGIWSYRWQGTRTTDVGQGDLVRVALPIPASSSAAPFTITIPVTSRIDPLNVDLPRGTDLVLRVSLANRVTTGLSGGVEFWQLEVADSCWDVDSAPQVSLFGRAVHPSELRIPWQWIEIAGASTSVCFTAFSSFEVAGSPYRASVGVSARLVWRIRVVG